MSCERRQKEFRFGLNLLSSTVTTFFDTLPNAKAVSVTNVGYRIPE